MILEKNRYVFIGDMSVQKIVSNNNSVLSDMDKRVALQLCYYKFQQRLEYKCKKYGRYYRKINECYTSKCCGNCKSIKEDLAGSETYNCKNC
jgi:IS605 OrfB family transposase